MLPQLNTIGKAYTSGLEQYPTVMTFGLPLSRPPGLTYMGDRYTGMCVADR